MCVETLIQIDKTAVLVAGHSAIGGGAALKICGSVPRLALAFDTNFASSSRRITSTSAPLIPGNLLNIQ